MRTTKIGFAAALSAILLSSSVIAGTNEKEVKEKPAVLEAAAAKTTATVTDIDYKTRQISLKREDGEIVSMIAGPEVTRLNDVKKGDVITVGYIETVAIVVQSPDKDIASAEQSGSTLIRGKGKKPSAVQSDTNVITATVQKIDAKKRTATLKGPQGNTFDVNIEPDVEHLENVKKGDQVLVKVTRTVAIEVSSPKK